MIRLEAIHIPVLQHHYFVWVLSIEEHPIAPGGRSLSIIDPFSLDVLVSGEEVDIALAVEGENAGAVVEEVLVLLQEGGEVGLHVRFS